jgi:hypothetical protein
VNSSLVRGLNAKTNLLNEATHFNVLPEQVGLNRLQVFVAGYLNQAAKQLDS